jgi:VWFA-related protein
MGARLRLPTLGLLLAPVLLAGQAPSPEAQRVPIFRTETTYVEVDVVVHDRDGRFLRDLSPADFQLFEDGAPQEVASFTLVDLPLPSAETRAAMRLGPPREGIDDSEPVGRVYAMLLDAPAVSRLAASSSRSNLRIRQLARQFVDESLTPEDRVSVTYVQHGPLLAQDLTADRLLIRGAVDRLSTPVEDGPFLNPFLVNRGTLAGYRAIAEAAEQLGTVNGRRRTIVWIGGSAPWNLGRMDSATAGAMAVAHRDAIRAATRNNVAIYPVDPAGLRVGRRSGIRRAAGLRDIAHETGGLAVVNTNNFSGGFERIVRDNSTYYLLGYYPAVDHGDGEFHAIDVRVNRPGARVVRARQRYFAPERSGAILPEAPPSPAAVAVAGLGGLDTRDPLRLRTAAWRPAEARGALWIVGELDAQPRREREWASGVTANVTVQAADSTQVFSTIVELDDQASAFALRTPDDVAIPPGAYVVRVQLRGTDNAMLSQINRITVPDTAAPLRGVFVESLPPHAREVLLRLHGRGDYGGGQHRQASGSQEITPTHDRTSISPADRAAAET